jgi:hypothetical protein
MTKIFTTLLPNKNLVVVDVDIVTVVYDMLLATL